MVKVSNVNKIINSLRLKKGFTLVEILVVVSIIALLSSVLFASFSQARARARDSKRIQDILEIKKALELYYAAKGKYPPPPEVYNGGGEYSYMRLSCWECNFPFDQFYDQEKLGDLSAYLNPRPDNGPNGQRFSSDGQERYKGYWYKVSGSQQDYKVALLGVIENDGSIPTTMHDTNFGNLRYRSECNPPRDGCYQEDGYNFVGPRDISIFSSERSRQWKGGDYVQDK